MKISTKFLIALCVFTFSFSSMNVFGISYVSAGVGPSDWTNSASWSPVGIPTSSDDVTIDAGHTININTGTEKCRNLTVDGTLSFTSNKTINVFGNYVVSASGAESAPIYGKVAFTGTGTTVTVLGTSHARLYYNFINSRTITAGSVITKVNAITQLGANKTLTNLGSLTLGTFTPGTGTTFINGTNATVSIKVSGFMSGRTFTADASGNTVILRYTTGAIPTTTSGYYNLSLMATVTGAKTLPSNTIIANDLTINSLNTLNSNNFDLTVGGNWTSSGTFTASAGKTVTFNGTASQTMSNTSGTTTFKRLTLANSNGLTLTSGTYILDEVLTISDGTFNTGGRPFTMTSTASATARIAPITGSGAIAGDFTIQRFITARDTTFTDLSSPVQNSTFGDWESELLFVSYVNTPPTAYATAATYDEAADEYVPVTSAGTSLNAGQGFEVFLSGGFDFTSFPATTMTTFGTPNQGDFDLSASVSNTVQGWNLVGNPFASSVSWSSIYTASGGASSGMYDYIEMYDHTIEDWNGFTSGDGIEIGSTQGFWVYGLSGPMTLLIPESSKTTTSNSSIKNASIRQPFFNLKLSNTATNFAHNFKIATSETASDGLDGKDIPFRNSLNRTTPEMYCMVDGKKININTFNSTNDSYSIALKTKANVSGTYRIDATGFEFLEYSCIKIEDKLTGQTIDLTEGNGYCFTMNADETMDRFIVTFDKNGNCKSNIASSPAVNFSNEVAIMPTAQGNLITFNLSETTNTNISVLNVLGQTIIESFNVDASKQSVNVVLPEGFSGLYFVKVESSKGAITKKFVRK